MIAKYSVALDLWERVTRANNTRSLVLIDFVVRDEVAAIIHHDSIRVVLNDVVNDPRETSLDAEDALRPRLVDQVIKNYSIS